MPVCSICTIVGHKHVNNPVVAWGGVSLNNLLLLRHSSIIPNQLNLGVWSCVVSGEDFQGYQFRGDTHHIENLQSCCIHGSSPNMG